MVFTLPRKTLFSPTKEATNGGCRIVINRLAISDLIDHALAHDGDMIGHGERFALIVGDVDEGDPDPLLNGAKLGAHVLAKFEVEGGERLVEKQHIGLGAKSAGDGDTLALAT